MTILTNVTFGLWCFGATNAWLKNLYSRTKNKRFYQKWKKDLNRLFWTKTIFNHALRITYRVRYHIDRNIYKKLCQTCQRTKWPYFFVNRSSTPSFADQKSVKKGIFSLQVKNAVNFKGIRKNNEKFRSRPVWSRVWYLFKKDLVCSLATQVVKSRISTNDFQKLNFKPKLRLTRVKSKFTTKKTSREYVAYKYVTEM